MKELYPKTPGGWVMTACFSLVLSTSLLTLFTGYTPLEIFGLTAWESFSGSVVGLMAAFAIYAITD